MKPKVTEQIRKMFSDSREFQRFLDDLSGITTFSNDLLKLFNARVAVASISNPVELKSISSEIESRLAITYSGTEFALYGYTTSTLIENIPYVVLSDSGGSWVAMGGKYINDGLNIIDLVSSYIEIQSTAQPQLTIKYDNANYADIGVDNSGNITLSPSGLVASIIGGLITTYANLDYIDLSTSATVTGQEARLWWNDNDKTLNIGLAGSSSVLQVGQEIHLPRAKATGSDILNGQVVYISGASGSKPEVTLAKADSFSTSNTTIAVATENVSQNSNGYFTSFGLVRDINTSAFNAGDALYLSATTAGALTKTAPTEPNNMVLVAYCVYSHASSGIIFVHIDRCTTLYSCVYGMTSTYVPYASSNGFLKQKSTFTFNDATDSLTVGGKVRGGTGYFGGATHYSEFESDGTLKFNNDATVWKDIMFPQAPPKATGAGNPTLVTWNGNLRGYSYAVNDSHDFDPQEIEHDAEVGSTATWHIHYISRANDGTNRTIKFRLEYVVEPISGSIPAASTADLEVTIPSGTAVNTPFYNDITTFAIPGIAKIVYVRISRIASSGTEPSVDPIISGLHFHYKLDTVGSRQITTK